MMAVIVLTVHSSDFPTPGTNKALVHYLLFSFTITSHVYKLLHIVYLSTPYSDLVWLACVCFYLKYHPEFSRQITMRFKI